MGKDNSSSQTGIAQLMTDEQQQGLMGMLQNMGPEANQALMSLFQGGQMDQGQMQDLFQQSFIDPAMMNFEQTTVPGIQQRFADAGASSSSALNQALGASARDLNTQLGSQMGQFAMGQQELGQRGQLGALGAYNQALGQKAFDPIITQKQGWMSPLIGAAGQAAGGWMGGGRR